MDPKKVRIYPKKKVKAEVKAIDLLRALADQAIVPEPKPDTLITISVNGYAISCKANRTLRIIFEPEED